MKINAWKVILDDWIMKIIDWNMILDNRIIKIYDWKMNLDDRIIKFDDWKMNLDLSFKAVNHINSESEIAVLATGKCRIKRN